MGYARYIGRVGALAVALGIGTAVAASPGVAWADGEQSGATSTADASPSQNREDRPAANDAAESGQDATGSGGGQDDPTEGLDGSVTDDDAAVTETRAPRTRRSAQNLTKGRDRIAAIERDSSADDVPETDSRSIEAPVQELPASMPDITEYDETPPPPPSEPATSVEPVIETLATGADVSQREGESSTVMTEVSSVLSPSGESGADVPVDSPLVWGLLAFARRQVGQRDPQSGDNRVVLGDTIALADPNSPPSGRAVVGRPGLFTSRVLGWIRGTDSDRDRLTYTVSEQGAKGKVTLTGNRFVYTPTQAARHAAAATNATASDKTDVFVVSISDGNGGVVAVPVTVALRPLNVRPVSRVGVGLPDMESGSVAGRIATVDRDDDDFTYTASRTVKGSVTFNSDGTFTYTPTEEARAAAGNRRAWPSTRRETFTVTVDDGHGGIDRVLVTVPIAAIDNEAPELDEVRQRDPGVLTGGVTGRVIATDGDDDRLTYSGSTTTAKGRVIVASNGRFVYTPTAAARHAAAADDAESDDKTDSFNVTVTDGFGGSLIVPVTVDITPRNAAPVLLRTRVSTPNQDSGVVTIRLATWDRDRDVVAFSGPESSSKGTLVVNDDGSLTYTPTAEARAAAAVDGAPAADRLDRFTLTVNDGHGGVDTAVVTVRIAPLAGNAAPTNLQVADVETDDDGVVTGRVTASDPNGDPLSYSGRATQSGKTLSVTVNADGTFTYVPTAAARHLAARLVGPPGRGVDEFEVTVSDGKGGTLVELVRVFILPKNSAPAGSFTTGSPAVGDGAVVVTVTSTDADGDQVTTSAPATSAKGSVSKNADGTFTYTPTAAARQAAAMAGATSADKQDSFVVTLDDGHLGGTATVNVVVQILPAPNSAPTGGTVSDLQADADGKVTGRVTATDVNADPLSYSGSGPTGKGSVVVNADGTFVYTPTDTARHTAAAFGANDADKKDSFTVTVSDGNGGSLAVSVTVDIKPKNTAPVGSFTAEQPNSVTGVVSGTVTATDADGDVRTYSTVGTTTRGGTVAINSATGVFTYAPSDVARQQAAETPGTDSDTFTVTVNDGHGGTAQVLVTVTVAPVVVTSESAPGYPIGGVIVGSTGTVYQVTVEGLEDISENQPLPVGVTTRVSILTADGRILTMSESIPGLAQLPIARPDGSLLVTTVDFATVKSIVSIIDSTGAVETVHVGAPSVVGMAVQLASDGTAYITGGSSIVAIAVDGTVRTHDLPSGFRSSMGVLGDDGSFYMGVSAGGIFDARSGIFVVRPDGTTFFAQIDGYATSTVSGGPTVTVGPDGRAYLQSVVMNPMTGRSTATVLTVAGSVVTNHPLPGAAVTSAVAGPGAVYFVVRGEAGESLVRVGASGVTAVPVLEAFGPPLVAGDGTAYLVAAGEEGAAQVIGMRADGSSFAVPLPGTVIDNLSPNSFVTSPASIGPDNKLYVPVLGATTASVVVVDTDGLLRTVDLSGVPLHAPVFGADGTPYQVIRSVDSDGGEALSVVVLSTGAATAEVDGSAFADSVAVVGGPGGAALLLVYDTNGYGGLRGLAFDRRGETIGELEDQGVVLGVPGTGVPTLGPTTPAVFGPDGTGYVTVVTRPTSDDESPQQWVGVKVAVWAFNASGVTKVFEQHDAGVTAPVTVAPDGTAYLAIVTQDSETGDLTTEVHVVSSPSVL